MDELRKWLTENVKPGTDIEAGLKLVPSNPVEALKTKEEALALIQKTPLLTSALDYHTTKKIELHDEKFASEKLPGLLKAEADRIRKELNPEETPEQKKIRELEDWKAEQLKIAKQNEIRASLRQKASELKFDPSLAEDYYTHGEKAVERLEAAAKRFEAEVAARVDAIAKERFGSAPPQASTQTPAKQMKRDEFMKLSPQSQMEFVRKEGGKVVD